MKTWGCDQVWLQSQRVAKHRWPSVLLFSTLLFRGEYVHIHKSLIRVKRLHVVVLPYTSVTGSVYTLTTRVACDVWCRGDREAKFTFTRIMVAEGRQAQSLVLGTPPRVGKPSPSYLARQKRRTGRHSPSTGYPSPPTGEDPDVIIPDDVARPLLFSAMCLLVVSLVAALRGFAAVSALAALVWATSLLHWSRPRFSSWRRHADYAMVVTNLLYSSSLAATHAKSAGWTLFWFFGLACMAALFACNETLYFWQVLRVARYEVSEGSGGFIGCLEACASGDSDASSEVGSTCAPLPTAPGSPERMRVYRRTVWVHALCVHVLASALAVLMLLRGLCPSGPPHHAPHGPPALSSCPE